MIDPRREKQLEELFQRQFAKLPDRQAPSTLMPRVLAAIKMRARHWWQRPWLNWPSHWQVLSLALSVSAIILAVYGSTVAWHDLRANVLVPTFAEWFKSFAVIIDSFETLGRALWLVLSSVKPIWLIAAGSFLFAMYVSCLGLGTMVYRISTSRRIPLL